MPNVTYSQFPYFVFIEGKFLTEKVDYENFFSNLTVNLENNDFSSENLKGGMKKISFEPTFLSTPKNCIMPNVIPQECVFLVKPSSINEAIEQEILNKFGRIDKVKKVFIRYEKDLTLVKVFIDTKKYDYNLMDKIFNEAEFPIKDNFQNKLFDFEYMPSPAENEEEVQEQYKPIYSKIISEVSNNYAIFTETIPTLTCQI